MHGPVVGQVIFKNLSCLPKLGSPKMHMFESTLGVCLLAKNAGENCKHAKWRSKHRGQLSLQFVEM